MSSDLEQEQLLLLEPEIDRRPVVTCAGELEVFTQLEDNLSQCLPKDGCEWRRSLGRPVKNVHISAHFVPYSAAALPKPGQWDLIKQPVFHIFWTECTDIDAYKSSVKEDIDEWLKDLTSKEVQDWLIVNVENYDGKRSKQLIPRTTVLDKIRTDFALKQGDRCISVINPGKATDSWKGLVERIRHLLLVAYARAVSRLEDYVRQQREKRNEPGWNFMKYFMLQEELAQVLEMLGLNDEALVQYDELDALFSQFVAGFSTSHKKSKWLHQFQKPLERWHGLKLGSALLEENPSLLELRAHIFAKQSQMLLLTNKIWEMASRCLPYLHMCVRELSILEVTAPPGAVWCWLFLATMEVLQFCDKYNQADQVEEYSLHTASLWEYASSVLRNLGQLCGLMPNDNPTSEQFHIVVGLSAGMGDNPGPINQPSPTDKLKEALSYQDVFIKTYLELAELAMGTYKHVGRLRKARLVGKEVATFYLLLGETQKAAAFLGDALRAFEADGWHELAAQVQILLAECHKTANDNVKYAKSCAFICTSLEIDTLIRWTYFDELIKYLLKLEKLDQSLILPFSDMVKMSSLRITNDIPIMQGSKIDIEFIIESNFPKEILCTYIGISLEKDNKEKCDEPCYCGKVLTKKDFKKHDPILQRLKIRKTLDYKQDKALAASGIASKFTLQRKTSSPAHNQLNQSNEVSCLEIKELPFLLTPGVNLIRLTKQATDVGTYYLTSAVIKMNKMQLVSEKLPLQLSFEVRDQQPSIDLFTGATPLLSGTEQTVYLILTIGSYHVEADSRIRLTASPGLSLKTNENSDFTSSIEIQVGEKSTFSSTKIPLRIYADLTTKDPQVTINAPWSTKPVLISLTFTPPMSTSWRLQTVGQRKFIQVNVVGQCLHNILAQDPMLKIKDALVSLNNCDTSVVISNGLNYCFVWELINYDAEIHSVKAEFALMYKFNLEDTFKTYQYYFTISDIKTLYTLDAVVEPAKGNEFCRVGVVCNLHLSISSIADVETDDAEIRSVMYEVLAEQNVWAVCGRTVGVVCFTANSDETALVQQVILDVMPLTSGFLPLPLVRISKYIPAETSSDQPGKADCHPRLEPFSPGQVYNRSKGKQLHIIAASTENNPS